MKQHEWLLSFPSLLLVIGIILSHTSTLQRFSAFQISKLTVAVNLDFTRDLELPFFVLPAVVQLTNQRGEQFSDLATSVGGPIHDISRIDS